MLPLDWCYGKSTVRLTPQLSSAQGFPSTLDFSLSNQAVCPGGLLVHSNLCKLWRKSAWGKSWMFPPPVVQAPLSLTLSSTPSPAGIQSMDLGLDYFVSNPLIILPFFNIQLSFSIWKIRANDSKYLKELILKNIQYLAYRMHCLLLLWVYNHKK